MSAIVTVVDTLLLRAPKFFFLCVGHYEGGGGEGKGRATKKKEPYFWPKKRHRWPKAWGGVGGKALVTGELLKHFFTAAFTWFSSK